MERRERAGRVAREAMEGEMVARFMGGMAAVEVKREGKVVLGGVMALVKFGVTMMTRESSRSWPESSQARNTCLGLRAAVLSVGQTNYIVRFKHICRKILI
jgi:hypothetical protein